MRWESVQLSKLFSSFQRNFSWIFFIKIMKRKIDCLYLGKIFLCLMARYLCYSEIWYSVLNFTCANVIIYSICQARQTQASLHYWMPHDFPKYFNKITATYFWIICDQLLSIPPFEESWNSVCTSRSSQKQVSKKLARQSSCVNPSLRIVCNS